MTGAERISAALMRPKQGPTALVAYLTAGWPTRDGFRELLDRVAEVADVVEIGVPFSDPMADGVTLQRTAREALAGGVTLKWITDLLAQRGQNATPTLLMGYTNPFLQFGWAELATACGPALDGLIVPDLPLEESGACDRVASEHGLGMVRLVAPNTPDERLARLIGASSGFLYAVTVNGITGSAVGDVGATLERVATAAKGRGLPVCAGFGVRTQQDVLRLGQHVDGVIVGTALADAIARGDDPISYLRGLRAPA